MAVWDAFERTDAKAIIKLFGPSAQYLKRELGIVWICNKNLKKTTALMGTSFPHLAENQLARIADIAGA